MRRPQLKIKDTAKEVYSVVLRDVSSYGGFPFYGVVILSALLFGDYIFATTLAISLVVVTIAVSAIRLAYFKPRPGMKPKQYDSIYERVDNSSFPSIHAARSVMISMAIIAKFPVLLPLTVLLVILVCLSRIHMKRHDVKDLAVGLLLGGILGALFL